MSATYKELLIETREQYEELSARYSALLRKKRLTTDEKVLERLLELLLQDYDRRHEMPPDGFNPSRTAANSWSITTINLRRSFCSPSLARAAMSTKRST
jgi:hypothetical protein